MTEQNIQDDAEESNPDPHEVLADQVAAYAGTFAANRTDPDILPILARHFARALTPVLQQITNLDAEDSRRRTKEILDAIFQPDQRETHHDQ